MPSQYILQIEYPGVEESNTKLERKTKIDIYMVMGWHYRFLVETLNPHRILRLVLQDEDGSASTEAIYVPNDPDHTLHEFIVELLRASVHILERGFSQKDLTT